jgi:hypothetical protein
LRRLIEELEARQQAAINTIVLARNQEDMETAAANEATAEADANQGARGMSHKQAYDWLKARGFELLLRKGVIEIAPKDAAIFSGEGYGQVASHGAVRAASADGRLWTDRLTGQGIDEFHASFR